MGISSAMNAGVMGLNVNSSKLSTISDNIANSETKGYKRTNVEFSSLVLTERPTSYDAGGVRAATVRDVDDQGALLSTRNNMDLAISGRGFLPVTDIAAIERGETDLPQMLTRTGSFRPDENGVMRTNSGYALMGWKAADGGFPQGVSRESAIDLDPVNIRDIALAAEPTSKITLGANLDARLTGQNLATPPEAFGLSSEYFDILGGSEAVKIDFLPDNTNANQWTMTINDASSNPATEVGQFTLEFADETITGTSVAGYLLNVNKVSGPASTVYDAATGEITVELGDGLERAIVIGAEGVQGPLSQFKAESAPSDISKDGSPVSDMVGLEISEAGVMDAIFASGFRKSIYKIPMGSVQNPNGLNALDGQVYTLSRDSGSVYYYDAGAGPTGRLVSSALEESTTDIAEELTQLIKTQRAYSSNAKIIQTVDEMLQETTNLKR